MTAKKQSGATPQQYDKAFREEAVRMWKASGKAAEVTARELGISVFRLYDWNRGGGRRRRPGRVSKRGVRRFCPACNRRQA